MVRSVLRVVLVGVLSACGSSNLEMSPGATGGGSPMRMDAGSMAAGGAAGGSSAGGVAGGSTAGGAAGGAAGGQAGGDAGGAGGGMAGGAAAGGDAGGMAGCSAASCATGCCLNGTCQPGTQPLACGTMGMACAQCMAGTTCQMQACRVDPTSMWRVRPVSATIAMRKANGDTWDINNGSPDVFVTMYCPATASSGTDTATVDNTFMPAWAMGGCTMTAGALQMTGFAFSVTDADGFPNPDDTITGKTTVRLMPTDFTSPMLMRGPVGQTQSITFALTRM